MSSEYVVIGGAGFIGSQFVETLINNGKTVSVVDNFCSGTIGHLKNVLGHSRLSIKEIDVEATTKLITATKDSRVVIHLASNPDIAKAASEPRVDFTQGTVLTESVAEAARINGTQKIFYASGSGVYGDAGNTFLDENSPLNPISTYGASKLAGESILSAYSYMFGLEVVVFRFANVVGPKQTHGVGYDFINKLKSDPTKLEILGDGKQDKSYVFVGDVVSAVLGCELLSLPFFDVFNISVNDSLTVNEIAMLAIEALNIETGSVKLNYTGGARGWKADVPVVRLKSDKIRGTGWSPKYSSQGAMVKALKSLVGDIEALDSKLELEKNQ
jgi:UDP-glucose 4-epimerase